MPIRTELTPYGYRCAFSGRVDRAELELWSEQVRAICLHRPCWGQLVDNRYLEELDPALDELVRDVTTFARERGLIRSAVVVADARTAAAVMQQSLLTGRDAWERYLDASADPDWERNALAWIERGLDPDRRGLVDDVRLGYLRSTG